MPLCKLAYRCLLRKEKKNEKKKTGEKERRMKMWEKDSGIFLTFHPKGWNHVARNACVSLIATLMTPP